MNMITGGGIRNIKDIEKLKDIGIKNVILEELFMRVILLLMN